MSCDIYVFNHVHVPTRLWHVIVMNTHEPNYTHLT